MGGAGIIPSRSVIKPGGFYSPALSKTLVSVPL
jgi:hypothetical protein